MKKVIGKAELSKSLSKCKPGCEVVSVVEVKGDYYIINTGREIHKQWVTKYTPYKINSLVPEPLN